MNQLDAHTEARRTQGSRLRLVADTDNAVARYAKSIDGSRETFVAAESCDAALGYRRKQIKPSGPKPWSRGKYRSICNFRLSGLGRLIVGRHGGPVDTDDGESYYEAVLPHLIAKAWAYMKDEDSVKSHAWAEQWTPALVEEKGRQWFEEQEQQILSVFDNHDGRPSIPSADDFARMLGITAAEVKRYDLKTVGAVDRLEDQRIAAAHEADRLYQKQRRAAAGATPRDLSLTSRQPWSALGMSRAKYYRKVANGELALDPAMRGVTVEGPEPEWPVLHLIRAA